MFIDLDRSKRQIFTFEMWAVDEEHIRSFCFFREKSSLDYPRRTVFTLSQWKKNAAEIEKFQAFRDLDWGYRRKFDLDQWLQKPQKLDEIQYWLWIDVEPDKRQEFKFEEHWVPNKE